MMDGRGESGQARSTDEVAEQCRASGRGRDGPRLSVRAAPRTDPSVQSYRTGLLPWVLPLSAAARSLPIGNRAELGRWRGEVRKMLAEVVA
jgi:hypothetical protein